jgi:hypothetical protein
MLEVIVPADSFDLTTIDAVKNEYDITSGDEDPIIAAWIAGASDVIARYCKRIFPAQTYKESFYNGHWRRELVLAQYPVAELIEVVENDLTLTTDTAGITDAQVNPDIGTVLRLSNDYPAHWPVGKVVVTYSAGFSNATGFIMLPPAIERACIVLVGLFRIRSQTNPAVRGVQHGDLSIQYGQSPFAAADDLPPEVILLLQPYRDGRVR